MLTSSAANLPNSVSDSRERTRRRSWRRCHRLRKTIPSGWIQRICSKFALGSLPSAETRQAKRWRAESNQQASFGEGLHIRVTEQNHRSGRRAGNGASIFTRPSDRPASVPLKARSAFTRVAATHSPCHRFVTRSLKTSATSSPPSGSGCPSWERSLDRTRTRRTALLCHGAHRSGTPKPTRGASHWHHAVARPLAVNTRRTCAEFRPRSKS